MVSRQPFQLSSTIATGATLISVGMHRHSCSALVQDERETPEHPHHLHHESGEEAVCKQRVNADRDDPGGDADRQPSLLRIEVRSAPQSATATEEGAEHQE